MVKNEISGKVIDKWESIWISWVYNFYLKFFYNKLVSQFYNVSQFCFPLHYSHHSVYNWGTSVLEKKISQLFLEVAWNTCFLRVFFFFLTLEQVKCHDICDVLPALATCFLWLLCAFVYFRVVSGCDDARVCSLCYLGFSTPSLGG